MGSAVYNGTCEVANGGIYVGELLDGRPHGVGRCLYPDGSCVMGEWQQGKPCGTTCRLDRGVGLAWADVASADGSMSRTYVDARGRGIEGGIRAGEFVGTVTLSHAGGGTTTVPWSGGDLTGDTVQTGSNGTYRGGLVAGMRCGMGEFLSATGSTYRGSWSQGLPEGHGVFYGEKNQRYEGEWLAGVPCGKGWYTSIDGTFSYEGYWRDGRYEGEGKLTWSDGTVYEGMFSDGQRGGQGRYQDVSGGWYNGAWDKDSYHGRGTIHLRSGVERTLRWAHGSLAFFSGLAKEEAPLFASNKLPEVRHTPVVTIDLSYLRDVLVW